MTNGANRATFVISAVSLGAILDHFQAMFIGQGHDRVHVTGPACQMNTDQSFGAGRQNRPDGVCREILRIKIDIGENRDRTRIDNTGDGRQKGA